MSIAVGCRVFLPMMSARVCFPSGGVAMRPERDDAREVDRLPLSCWSRNADACCLCRRRRRRKVSSNRRAARCGKLYLAASVAGAPVSSSSSKRTIVCWSARTKHPGCCRSCCSCTWLAGADWQRCCIWRKRDGIFCNANSSATFRRTLNGSSASRVFVLARMAPTPFQTSAGSCVRERARSGVAGAGPGCGITTCFMPASPRSCCAACGADSRRASAAWERALELMYIRDLADSGLLSEMMAHAGHSLVRPCLHNLEQFRVCTTEKTSPLLPPLGSGSI